MKILIIHGIKLPEVRDLLEKCQFESYGWDEWDPDQGDEVKEILRRIISEDEEFPDSYSRPKSVTFH